MLARSFIVILLVVAFVVAGCGKKVVAPSSFNQMEKLILRREGRLVFRGTVSGASQCPSRDGGKTISAGIQLEAPLTVEGVEAGMKMDFYVDQDTVIASAKGSPTTVREFMSTDAERSLTEAIPVNSPGEVEFIQRDGSWYATAMRRIPSNDAVPPATLAITQVLSTGLLSKSELEGSVTGITNDEDTIYWEIDVRVPLRGGEVHLKLPMSVTKTTALISAKGENDEVRNPKIPPDGPIKILFRSRGKGLEIRRVTLLPAPERRYH